MGEFFPERWTREGVDPNKLSRQAVDADRWDREDNERMLKAVKAYAAARHTLGEFTPTGEPAMSDTFWTFLKAQPDLLDPDAVRPSHLVNRRVIEEMQSLDACDRLRRYSVNDDVQAALSATTMEPDLETLFDKVAKQQEKADEFEKKLSELAALVQEQTDIDEMISRWKGEQEGDGGEGDEEGEGQGEGEGEGEGEEEGEGAGGGQGQPGQGKGQPSNQPGSGSGITDEQAAELAERAAEIAKQVEQARKEAEAAGQDFDKAMDRGMATVRMMLQNALNNAADEAESSNSMAQAWGLDPGELQRMPADKRLELAKRLNNERFRRVADLFGPMRNMMLSEQQRKTIHAKEEVYDIGIGNDLGRVLPSEILNLRDGVTRLDFLRRYSEGKLLQYEMKGIEKLSRGGIIFCEDGSGSMSGERELWAKAVMLCLLHLSRQQKRPFHVIHFGGPGAFKLLSFTKPEDYALENVLDAAELFYGGGTDFATPMKEALRLLGEEFKAKGAVRGDVVFCTDDECHVQDAFMKEYLAESDRMSFTTWGISVSGGQVREGGPLHQMSQGKVATIKDFLSGEDIRHIFRGV